LAASNSLDSFRPLLPFDSVPEYSSTPQGGAGGWMQRECMQRNSRKEGPDVWQFRWSETRLDGKRFYHKKIVGTVEQ
jgi:hypothetical protein